MSGARIRLKDLSPEQRKRMREAKRDAVYLAREQFVSWCTKAGLPAPVPEHRFHPRRRWRFDWAFPEQMVALEVEGGVWTEGRHTRGSGFVRDMEKYNDAACRGWRILRCVPDDLYSPRVLGLLRRALGAA